MTEQSDYLIGVLIYMEKSMREILKRQAHKHEMNMSEYVRSLINKDIEAINE